MKTRFLILFAIVFTVVFSSSAYGLVMPMTAQEVLDGFDLILLGTIMDKKQSEGNAPVYTIGIEEIVKKPDSFGMPKSVLAVGCNPNRGHTGTPCPSYEIGDRGLFLLASSEQGYEVSFYSQIAEPHCTSDQFLANYKGQESGLLLTQNGQSKTFFTGQPIDIHYTVHSRDMKEKDYSVMLSAHSGKFAYSDVVNGTVNECDGSKVVTASFVPTVMGVYGFNADSDEGGFGFSGMSIIDHGATPLRQYKAGVHAQDTWCKEDLLLVLMRDDTPNQIFDNKPACVKPNTISKFSERNVIELASFYNNRPLIERLYAGMEILRLSDIPITMMGPTDHEQVLKILIDEDISDKIPDGKDYFDRIIRETIPFNVPLKITFGKY
ncbi:MAG: hypothetical protein K8Q89_10275 [Nitrosarchaeum sp.]|nr:hypothetical protein [Nitrosarchaeum sp.]